MSAGERFLWALMWFTRGIAALLALALLIAVINEVTS